ncbi:MAG: TetR/AcrR family transcriptional regulator, partial [Candidatus Binataceae bacterium]
MSPPRIAKILTLNGRVSRAKGLGRSARHQRDKLERIKRAARALFGRNGFEATTTREIAEAADIGAGTLFLYAGTKEDLLVLIFREEVGREVDKAFATIKQRPLEVQLLHVFGAMIAHHERNPGLARVFVKELPFVRDRRHGVHAFMSSLLGRIANLIERAQKRGDLSGDVSPSHLAHNLFALYFAELQSWLGAAGQSANQRDARLAAALELHLQGLRTAAIAHPPLPNHSGPRSARRAT